MDRENHRVDDRKTIEVNLHEVTVQKASIRYRAGDLCPKCHQKQLDYNGMLNLVCPNCGLIEGGVFTC